MATSHTCCQQKKANCTDVVIIGNGPSAITLSYMLHGYRPYYNGGQHSNSILVSKLQDSKASVVEQDLEFLSEGLEGRSTNPVALLWDTLSHPDADLGTDNPSVLDWRIEKERSIPHVVLGKMKAGGSWQRMEGNMYTISQNTWMELPGCSFKEWLAKRHHRLDVQGGRATVADVRSYYEEYVELMGLKEHYRDFHVVTSIQKVFNIRSCADSENGEVEHCCQNIQERHFLWEVRGFWVKPSANNQHLKDSEEKDYMKNYICHSNSDQNGSTGGLHEPSTDESVSREEFCFLAPNVVLATGAYDVPNKLRIKGENLPSVLHSLCAFEQLLKDGSLTSSSSPVCVVGAGLSAADAILMALGAGIPVIHVFRRSPHDPSLIFKKLPRSMYPEYQKVASLMKGQVENELYQAYPRHRLVEVSDQMVFLKPCSPSSRSPSPPGLDDSIISVEVSCTVIMIGSRPDLSFLSSGGRNLGVVPKWPIDSKHNPIDVDLFTYQSVHEPRLFAMGPLIGDNFVRFGIGGALGITSHLSRSSQKDSL